MKHFDQILTSQNFISECVDKFLPIAVEHFRQFEGKKISNADGNINKRYTPDHETFSFKEQRQTESGKIWVSVHCWFECKFDKLYIHLRTCVSGGSWEVKPATAFTNYNDVDISFAELDDDRLLLPIDAFKNDRFPIYSAEEVMQAAYKAEEAREAYREAYLKVPSAFRDLFYLKYV